MKHFTVQLPSSAIAILLVLITVGSVMAQNEMKPKASDSSGQNTKFAESKMELIEENLVRDLESPSVGVCIDGAQRVRELKAISPDYPFSKAIIPLMRIVKDSKADRAARILAALALHDLNSEKGDFAISREAEFSDDVLFKSVCANLARSRKEMKAQQH